MLDQSIINRFWSKVDKSGGPDACWPWTAAQFHYGHGAFSFETRTWKAHRFAMLLEGHDIEGTCCLHHCDNPPCCNPKHLYLGTQKDNCQDRERRGRSNPQSGEKHWKTTLTTAQTREIRELRKDGVKLRVLSARYGVAQSTISRIANGVRRATG